MVALQRADLLRPDERETELAVGDALPREDATRELDGRVRVDVLPTPIFHFDLDQRYASDFPVGTVAEASGFSA
jgi:hypothetical protein